MGIPSRKTLFTNKFPFHLNINYFLILEIELKHCCGPEYMEHDYIHILEFNMLQMSCECQINIIITYNYLLHGGLVSCLNLNVERL